MVANINLLQLYCNNKNFIDYGNVEETAVTMVFICKGS